MSFHRGGNYAVNFGLDSDNVLRIGGWSAAANIWQLDMGGVNTVASSFRAPIFYDSQDTGVYMDSSGSNFNSTRVTTLGVNTPAGSTGEIRATNNITAYYSDERLKTRLGKIDNALEKVLSLNGFFYEANEVAQALGYDRVREVGISAQEVQKVLPEVVVAAPIDDRYLTVRYEKLIPLLIEAIKDQQNQIIELKRDVQK
jgi:hypothetical protein